MKLRHVALLGLLIGACAKQSPPTAASTEISSVKSYKAPTSEAAAPAPVFDPPEPGRYAAGPQPMPSAAPVSTPTMPMAPPAVVALPAGNAGHGYVTDTTVTIDGVMQAGQQGRGGGGKDLIEGQMALALRKEAPDTGAHAGDLDQGGDTSGLRQKTTGDFERNERRLNEAKQRPKAQRPVPQDAGWDQPVEPIAVAEPAPAEQVAPDPSAIPPEKPAEKNREAKGPSTDANVVLGGTLSGENGAFAAVVAADKKGKLYEEEEVDEELAVNVEGEKLKESERVSPERRASRTRGEGRRRAVTQRLSQRPTHFLPDFFYFENTYLGGDAGYRESLRRLDRALAEVGAPHRLSHLPDQAFDAPVRDGLGLLATATPTMTDGPGRVFLQVGLRGSDRHGWRRPPLEVVVVLDSARLGDDTPGGKGDVATFIEAVLSRLGPQDRVAIVAAGQTEPLATLGGLRQHRAELLPTLEEALRAIPKAGSLAGAMTRAGWIFVEASRARTTAPGTQVLLLLTRSDRAPEQVAAEAGPVASQLALGGVVTSVVGLSSRPDDAALWTIAAAGHGNAHAALSGDEGSVAATVDAELELLSRVVARLIRVNVKLAPGVKAIRVLGSRPLLDEEVRVVKAREVETDRRLSQVLGITADRGDDDDGIQTVIPVFYGGDSHVLVLELWAEGAGPVADVTLRYKDMVNLDNRSARTSVSVRGHGRDAEPVDPMLASTRDAMVVGDALRAAASSARNGDLGSAITTLDQTSSTVSGTYGNLLRRAARGELDAGVVVESLELAARRAVGGGG
ncbi:MAG: hypothetical protein IV100_04560 [Myxococcales bacterium]|nr:hypothetical protein [Myxococcales bacterium]